MKKLEIVITIYKFIEIDHMYIKNNIHRNDFKSPNSV